MKPFFVSILIFLVFNAWAQEERTLYYRDFDWVGLRGIGPTSKPKSALYRLTYCGDTLHRAECLRNRGHRIPWILSIKPAWWGVPLIYQYWGKMDGNPVYVNNFSCECRGHYEYYGTIQFYIQLSDTVGINLVFDKIRNREYNLFMGLQALRLNAQGNEVDIKNYMFGRDIENTINSIPDFPGKIKAVYNYYSTNKDSLKEHSYHNIVKDGGHIWLKWGRGESVNELTPLKLLKNEPFLFFISCRYTDL